MKIGRRDFIGSGSALAAGMMASRVTRAQEAAKAPSIPTRPARIERLFKAPDIHPNALEYATGHPVVTEITGSMEYLQMCGHDGEADLLLIAPATANTLGKVANGIDDSTVTTYATNALGSGIPVLVAPAAHESMMDNPAVAANLRRLKEIGVEIVEPTREEGKAKMADPETVTARVIRRLGPRDLAGVHVLVVTGATVEPMTSGS